MAKLETYGGYYLWNYIPSIAAAVIFCILFATATLAVSWRMLKTRTWFCIPFVLGGFFEFIGYAARASAYNQTGRLMPYVIQSTFILLGPALFAASIYMSLGQMIHHTKGGARHTIIRADFLTRTFVLGDVVSFVVIGGAAGLMVTGKREKMGEAIVIVGLLIQVVMFGLFAVTAVLFEVRMKRDSRYLPAPGWVKRNLNMLYVVSGMILVRSITRVVEYAMGAHGYLLAHEWTLYVFDALLMFAVMVVFCIWYPSFQPAEDEIEFCETE